MTSNPFEETGSANISSANGSGDFEENANEPSLSCPPSTHVVVPIFYGLIAAFGLLANFLVVYIIVILKEYQKTITNVYVVQLATADFMFLFILPFEASQLVNGYWGYGEGWCKITKSIQMLNYYSSIMFLTVMSVDRYIAINHAMNAKMLRFRTKRAVAIISIVVWTLSFLCVVYLLVKATVRNCDCLIEFDPSTESVEDYSEYDSGDYSGEYGEDNATNYNYVVDDIDHFKAAIFNAEGACSFKEQHELSLWIICNFILAFVFPLLVICACYAQILLKIFKKTTVGVKSNKTRQRVTVMVTALVTVFIVCWLPYHAFNLSRVNDSQLSHSICDPIEKFTLVFAYLSSALNPFLYTFLGTNFRKRWTKAVGRTRSFRPSFGSRSDYVQGQSRRRKSSRISMTGHKGHDEDTLSQSNVTKHTVVQNNLHVQKNEEDAV